MNTTSRLRLIQAITAVFPSQSTIVAPMSLKALRTYVRGLHFIQQYRIYSYLKLQTVELKNEERER